MNAATQAIILAAGRGSRMGPLTAGQPKCMAVLAGQRLIDWQVAALTAGGMTSIAVVAGYRSELLASDRYRMLVNRDWATTNMVATLRCANALLTAAPSLVSYSDIVYRPDRVAALAAANGDIVVSYDIRWESLWRARFADPLSDAETFRQADGRLLTIGERARDIRDIEGQYIGLVKVTPHGWQSIAAVLDSLEPERARRIDVTNLIRELLVRDVEVRCVAGDGAWCEVDNATDLALYEHTLELHQRQGTRWDHDWRW